MNPVKNQTIFTTSRIALLAATFLLWAPVLYAQLPHFKKNEHAATQLIVHGKPFLMIAGEANNSSGSHVPHMEQTMKALREFNLNSLLVSVTWEMVESEEGVSDFTSVDEFIRIARENDLKLCRLWFASWKNGLSTYAPMWVLSDTERFDRVKHEQGSNTRTLTPLCKATREADGKAYVALMKHIAAVDSQQNTIIVMQIENEVGTLGQSRDFSAEANEAFKSQVPPALIQYLVENNAPLEIELKTAWQNQGSKTTGTWTEVFGPGDVTDLLLYAFLSLGERTRNRDVNGRRDALRSSAKVMNSSSGHTLAMRLFLLLMLTGLLVFGDSPSTALAED